MIPFNYHHLYYFYVIAKEGSIAKATEKLRLQQPTLSTQLKQFERYLKMQLFNREGKKLILTKEGQYVLSYAKEIFDIGQEFLDHTKDLSHKGRAHIQIGVVSSVPKTIIEALLHFILKTYPSTHISMIKSEAQELTNGLLENTLDIILTDVPFEFEQRRDFQQQLVGKIPIVFCVHPKLKDKFKRFPKDMHEAPFIMPAAPRSLWFSLRDYLAENGIVPNIIAEIEDLEIVRRLALRGHGVAPINLLTVKEAPTKDKFVILNNDKDYSVFEHVYVISRKKKRTNPIVLEVLKGFKIENFITKGFL